MISVTCAIIRNDDNEVLVVQRGEKTDHPLKWEFPGGKPFPGETEEDCIIREIAEELSMDIVICSRLKTVIHDYGHKQIELIPFICDTLDELPILAEHIDFRWVYADDLPEVDFSEADLFVADEYLATVNKLTVKKKVNSKTENVVSDDSELRSMINNMMSTQEVEWVASSAIENPAIFSRLIEYSYSPEIKLAFRASWTLSKVCDRFPELIYPHLTRIIEALEDVKNESAHRSFLRILTLTDVAQISPRLHGILADHCFKALNSGFSAIAVKAYSMEILYKLAVVYPELANELSASVNMLQGEGSAGIKARGRIILKKLAELTSDRRSGQPKKNFR